MQCGHLKQRFLDLNKVAFWDGQEVENEFKVTCEHLKHRFLEFTQVVFLAGQEEEVPSAFRPFETLLSQIYQSRILVCQDAQNDF